MAAKNSAEETVKNGQGSNDNDNMSTTEYCQRLQQWMWRYYSGYVSWQSWVFLSAPLFPPPAGGSASACAATPADIAAWCNQMSSRPAAAATSSSAERAPAQPAGREYTIPSPLRRFLAETVDFFILFCVKATIVLWIMHLSGMRDISKFMMQFIVEEIDENTSLEDLQKMMVVALAYRVLVCVYEIICIWGAGGATPGKFLLGLRVVTCDTTVLVQPNQVLVVPASSVSLSARDERCALLKFDIHSHSKQAFAADVKMRRSIVIVTHRSGFAEVPLRSRDLCEVSGEEDLQLLSSTQ
ncbi:protein FAM8A1-like [Sinocyclocheilus rhinocerous]|uniref:protein FAM8A1-like n=1 Tax=Sinocyclocheilus rhinocerous TaxID=307959 RepID=UPI0007B7FD26|nr:PREDICTED: protein FAM8A1-like [Sinocyclocheilus rhinocerous]